MRNVILLLMAAFIAPHLSGAEKLSLPAPSGPFAVGTRVYFWEDRTREEPWTKDPSDRRALVVQLWYPAAPRPTTNPAPYVPERHRLRSSLERYWPGMPEVRTHAGLNVGVATEKQKYPLVVFSHGMNSARYFYTWFLEELASHGFIVAAIDHTYWTPGEAFPNGNQVNFEETMVARDTLSSDEIDRMMQEGIIVMAADQSFVVERLRRLQDADPIARRIDFSQIAAAGHSMGGMAATRSCVENPAVRACLNLDGHNPFPPMMPELTAKPFLLLRNSEWGLPENRAEFVRQYRDTFVNPLVILVRGTNHRSFTDFAVLDPRPTSPERLEPTQAYKVIARVSLAFLNQSLRNEEGLLQDAVKQSPELESIEPANLPNGLPAPQRE